MLLQINPASIYGYNIPIFIFISIRYWIIDNSQDGDYPPRNKIAQSGNKVT